MSTVVDSHVPAAAMETLTVNPTHTSSIPAGSVVVVSANPQAAPKADAIGLWGEVTQAITTVESATRKAGDAWAPWKKSKNKKRADAALGELGRLQPLLGELEKLVVQGQQENATLKTQTNEQTEIIAQLRQEVALLKEAKADKSANVSSLLSKVEGVTGGPKRYLKIDDRKEAELLQTRLEQLIKDHEKLKVENERLNHNKIELTKRIKELSDQARDEAEVRERESRRANADIKKAHEEKEAALSAVKAGQSEQVAAKVRELKALQKRFEPLKNEVASLKASEQALRKQAEESASVATKAQLEAKASATKLSQVRSEKEELMHLLASCKEDMGVLKSEYSAVVKNLARATGKQSLPACEFVGKATGAFPRQAFTARGSPVLHNGTCNKASDATRIEARDYKSCAELSGWLCDGTYVLCPSCKVTGF